MLLASHVVPQPLGSEVCRGFLLSLYSFCITQCLVSQCKAGPGQVLRLPPWLRLLPAVPEGKLWGVGEAQGGPAEEAGRRLRWALKQDFPGGSDGKASAYKAGNPGSVPGLGGSPGEGNGNPLRYSCLGNPMDRGAWQATVHGVAKSRTQLNDITFAFT